MRNGKLGADAFALAALGAVSVISASGAGCSTTKPTELVPGVSSQVVVPHDLQAIRLTVTANGGIVFDRTYDVGPDSTVTLPSTLGVISGESAQTVVAITVRGYETPCDMSPDCMQLGNAPVGDDGSRILRRSIQSFVDQHTLFVPMPLTYSCWNTDCGAEGMGCKGNQCVDATMVESALVDFDPSLVDGTDVCFNPQQCFGDPADGGKSLAIVPSLVNADDCTYELPAIPGIPATAGQLNVRVYYQNFGYVGGTPVLKTGGEQEILNEDAVEGFTLVGAPDGGAPDAGTSGGTFFQLAPGLCKLVQAAANPPPPPVNGTDGGTTGGASSYITISDIRVSNLCPPKKPLLPICAGYQVNSLPTVPGGEMSSDGVCNVGVALAPTQSALYLVMDDSAVMDGAFGPMGSATALSLSLSDPVFKRTFAAFTFLPGQAADCTGATTPFTTPKIPFGLAGTVQSQIAAQLDGWVPTDTKAMPSPLELQAAMRLDAGAYAAVIDFLKGKELPNIAAAMFFANRAPDLTNDCNPPLANQTTVKAALESEISAAFNGTPSLQTYFVVLDDDAHDTATPAGALTFYKQVQADLPQAVVTLDGTQAMTSMQAAQTEAANFSKLVTQLGTCLYDDSLPAGTDLTKVEVAFNVPGQPSAVVPHAAACNAANAGTVDGWNIDNGRLRICGGSCSNLRNGILASAAAALQMKIPAQDVPVTATILCSGSGPENDAGPDAASDGALEETDAGSVANGDGGGNASSGPPDASASRDGSFTTSTGDDSGIAPADASVVLVDAGP
jgi:hypothetical protein